MSSMFYNAPTISVGGVGRIKVYSLDLSAQTIDTPGKITVTYIDKDNNLPRPNLSYTSPVNISVGGVSLKAYPVSYRRSFSSEGESLLVVNYVDESFLLDKYFVGLRSKHWNVSTNYTVLYNALLNGGKWDKFLNMRTYTTATSPEGSAPNFLILVGSPIDPCGNKFNNQQKEDLCDPCPSASNSNATNESSIDCEKERSMTIFDYDYTFSDLASAVSTRLRMLIPSGITSNYRANYVGSLREVLQAWCSDFGFSFFVSNGFIRIYDLKAGVSIPLSLNENQTTLTTEEESIENTSSTIPIAHLAINGSVQEYNCSSTDQKVVCRAVTMRDLVGKSLQSSYGSPVEGPYYKLLELVCMLSGYSAQLRKMVTWFDIYGIRTARDLEGLIGSSGNKSRISGIEAHVRSYTSDQAEDVGIFSLPLLNMTVKKVIKKGSTEFRELMDKGNLTDSIRELASSASITPYFFVASSDDAAFAAKTGWESQVATNFLGKYFLRMYETYSNSTPEVRCCGSDNATFYKQGVSSLEFADLIPPFNERVQDFLGDGFRPRGAGSGSLSIYNYTGNDRIVKDSFILVGRNSNFSPSLGQNNMIDSILELSRKHEFLDLGQVENCNVPSVAVSPVTKKKFGPKDRLYLGFEMPSGFNVRINDNVNSPFESEQEQNKNGKCKEISDSFLTPVDIGLLSVKCRGINIGGGSNFFQLFYPAQACVSDAGSGYSVLVNNNKNIGKKLSIPKFENVSASWLNNIASVGSIKINYKEISLEEIEEYISKTNANNAKGCLPNENLIRQYMDNYVSFMASSNTFRTIKKTFELVGLPTNNYSIEDGLVDFNIRVSSSGVKSFLTFSNLKDRDTSKSTQLKEFEFKSQNILTRGFPVINSPKNLIANSAEEVVIS